MFAGFVTPGADAGGDPITTMEVMATTEHHVITDRVMVITAAAMAIAAAGMAGAGRIARRAIALLFYSPG